MGGLMTQIVIDLAQGPDGEPVGRLRGADRELPFTGWLDLIRLLEDELTLAAEVASQPQPGSPPAAFSES
jgi:hypothetical protein